MKPKPPASNILSAFAVFKQNRGVKKGKELKPTSLTPSQVKALKKSGVLAKSATSLNGSMMQMSHKSASKSTSSSDTLSHISLQSLSPIKLKKKGGQNSAKKVKKGQIPECKNTEQNSVKMVKKNQSEESENIEVEQNFEKKMKKIRAVECGNLEAEKCFIWLISPLPINEFFQDVWEKKPIYLKRAKSYFKGIFGCSDFDKILRTNHLEYNTNIDVVSYFNGERHTFSADGRAYAAVIWDHYQNGSSIRLLNPQTYSSSLWKLCSLLGEYFGSFCGANMYLTPPGSQGFAPHYDDIEAFVLQMEGKKMWKVYAPKSEEEELPRFSSRNFSQDEIGNPILEVTLKPGDLLYMPRGYIHQAQTAEDDYSLHITVSTYQKHTWGDFLMKLLPKAIDDAMENDIQYRESLPINYMNSVGMVNTSKDANERESFMRKIIHLTKGLVKYLSPDAAADLTAKDFIHSALPPSLTFEEKSKSIHGNGERWEDGHVVDNVELDPETEIRFIRKRAVRLFREDNMVKLYHSFENSRIYKEKDPQYVVIEYELIPAVEQLLETCPEYVKIEDLALNNLDEKMNIASLLYDKGLIETKIPLSASDDEC